MIRRPPKSPLFPYPTLFRSGLDIVAEHVIPTAVAAAVFGPRFEDAISAAVQTGDRKSTRLNSSHANISYAVFCLKKKTRSFHSSPELYDYVMQIIPVRVARS